MSVFALPTPLTATIAGAEHPTRAAFDVINPATGEIFATAPDASAADIGTAVRAAHEAFAAGLADSARVGDGTDPATQYGPLDNRPQRDRVAGLVAVAVRQGATLAAGGSEIAGNGFFHQPTILTDISDGVRIVDDEQFGPALPIIGYHTVEDALARANATHLGLGASVWGGDTERAAVVAERMEAGMAWVNTRTATSFDQPFAGVRWSGIGIANGRWALEGFTEMHVVHRAL